MTKNSESGDVYDNLDNVISTLQEIIQIAHDRLDDLFIIQKSLTKLVLSMDMMVDAISSAEQQLQKDYFVFDSKPIWKISSKDSVVTDTLATEIKTSEVKATNEFDEDKRQLNEFLFLNSKIFVFQIIFILLILALLLIVRKKWIVNIKDITNSTERDAKIVLNNPLAATIVVGVLISAFFYDALIPVLAEVHIILVLTGSVILLPKLTNRKMGSFLLLLLILYLIDISYVYINWKSFVRWLMIGEAIVLIYALLIGFRHIKKYPEHFGRISSLSKIIFPVYIFLTALSFISNIIGMTMLAEFLIFGVLASTVLGMVVFLAVKIITSITVILLKLRGSTNIQTLTTMVQATNQRLQPILLWIGLFVWIYFTLQGFNLYDYLITWLNESLLIHWKIGEMTISLGGILSFAGIFVMTILLAKLTAAIFQDEWMVQVLPRGVAPAISLILRIVLVTIGLYMSLTAAGLDLSKLGFIIGALGVGIGFGLQSIVLNFIAGLILAFERPINLGDTIEIDQEFGVVTSIGVRSSTIRTYSGSEAIIPNGDLISKKVINWTLKNRDRRSKELIRTSAKADPEKVIEIFNNIASEHPNTFTDPAPLTYFRGFSEDGNLKYELLYWTTFSDKLTTNHDIAMKIYSELKENGLRAPAPVRRIIND